MILTLDDVDLTEKQVIIREDFNVPIQDGKIENDTRLKASLPTIQKALKSNAKIILLSHLGRPTPGEDKEIENEKYSLQPIASRLSQLLNHPVRFQKKWLDGFSIEPGEIVLCENVRFNPGELDNNPELSKKMASLCDVFIMDAFATAHRKEASTYGIAEYANVAVAGPLLMNELNALSKIFKNPKKPLVAIVGGAKISSKLLVLKSLLKIVDTLIVGGGIANTFMAALGFSIGKSLVEPDLIPVAKELLQFAKEKHIQIITPIDVVVSKEISSHSPAREIDCDNIAVDEKIGDVGKKTTALYSDILKNAGTILWNGPLGIFELEAFSKGTETLAKGIAHSNAFSVAGGGETLAAIDQFGVQEKISYISTGGGAFLEYLEGKTLPAIEILEKKGG